MSHIAEVFLAINEDGDATCSLESAEEARETLANEFGGKAARVVKMAVAMDLPVVPDIDVSVEHVDEEVAVEAKAGETEEEKREEFEAA
jgi:hypothetical protein